MSLVAILGAGDLGGAIARALARRSRVRQIRLIDDNGSVAAGKALDIQQSGPIDRSDTRIEATSDVLAASGASVIIVADTVGDGEWRDERALALVRQLARSGTTSAFVFAGPNQFWLMEAAARELALPTDCLIGTAPAALVGALRALVGVELDGTGTDVHVAVVGRPGAWVVGWSSATVAGTLLSECLPPHRLLAIERSLSALWPPGPQAIAAATAPVVEALAFGSRRILPAAAILDGEFDARGLAALLPLELGRGRILRRHVPSLSPRETGAASLWTRVPSPPARG